MSSLEACGVSGSFSPVVEIGTKRFGSWHRSTDTVNTCRVAVLALASDHGAAEVVFPGMDPSHRPVFLVGLALGAKLVVQLLKPLVVWDSNAIILVCSCPLSLPAVFQTSKRCYRGHRSKRMSQNSAEVQFSLTLRPRFRQAFWSWHDPLRMVDVCALIFGCCRPTTGTSGFFANVVP